MRLIRVAVGGCYGLVLVLSGIGVEWATASELSLQAAMARVARVHPQLKIFEARREILGAESDIAHLRPQLSIQAEIENVAGSGSYAGGDQGEYTLTLSGVLERGMKRELRRAAAMRRLDALGVERSIAELDLLAEVNRRYLDFVESTGQEPLFERARNRQRELAKQLRERHQAGALPEAIVLAAEAEASRLEADYQQALRAVGYAWQRLSMLWGEIDTTAPAPRPVPLPQSPLSLIELPDLLARVRSLPDIEIFASSQRLHDAELRLIEAERKRDIEWQVGIRRLEIDASNAWVAGFSVPLGQSTRIDLKARAERGRQQSLTYEKDQRLLELEATLIRVYGEVIRDREYLRIIDQDILPRLHRAVDQGDLALASGAMSYMELSQIQRELLIVQRARLQSQVNVLRGWVELQRLTGEPWSGSARTAGEPL